MTLVIRALISGVLLMASAITVAVSQPLVLHNVNVLTMESDQIHYNYSVLINEGNIEWVGPAADFTIPEGAIVVEGSYYVMPGLAEMHAHIPSPNQGQDVMENTLALYLSQGITTIRGMLGNPAHLELRERAAKGELFSPRIFTSGPSLSGNSLDGPESARHMVREQKEAGYDLLKFHPGITLENFYAATETANEVGIEFSGHISYEVGLERSLAAGKGSIDHLDRYMEYLAGEAASRPDPPIIYFGYDLTPHVDDSKIEEAARITAEAGVWNVPTNTLLENVFNPDIPVEKMQNWPGMEFIPSGTLANWSEFVNRTRQSDVYDADQARRFLEVRKQLTLALHEQGAGLLLGADAPQIFNPPGYSAHRELRLLVDAGLTPFEAIKTGTVNVGKYLGEEDETGKIAPGFRADLILLSVNPLENIPFGQQIEGVIYQGKYAGHDDLNQVLDYLRQSVE
ncbi:MAG: amidohydrolase [Balneolaceae bacterium]|nr:MAG: amidohydrolase [Balneolaceae bacterium]